MEMTLWTIVVYIQSDSPGGGTDPGTESDIYDCLINTVCLVCGARYMQRSGVRPSVCPSVRLSVCLSVPSIDRSSGLLRVCCWAPGGPEISIDSRSTAPLLQVRTVSRLQPPLHAERRLVSKVSLQLSRQHSRSSTTIPYVGQSWLILSIIISPQWHLLQAALCWPRRNFGVRMPGDHQEERWHLNIAMQLLLTSSTILQHASDAIASFALR